MLVFLAVVGASLVVSSEVVSEEQDPLGDSNIPEGVDIVQLPENVILGGTLPNNESRIENRELESNQDYASSTVEKNLNVNADPKVLDSAPTKSGLRSNNNEQDKKIVIHLKTQTMDMVEHGEVLNSFKISSGKRGMQTPTGTFKVLSKTPRAYSKTYGLYMPYWMAFTTRGHGIHELPEWPNGYKEGENHLGTPVSHGCVRLGVGPAKAMYDWAGLGTPVEVVL